MKLHRSTSGILLLLVLILSLPLQVHAGKKLTVYPVNYPLTYFAERIGGEHVEVIFPAPPDVDPAFWTPDTETVRKYQQADLIILNGADYAKWTKKVSLPMMRTVDTSRSFKDNLINIESSTTHSHGPAGDHSHGGTAFTTWLDFDQAVLQADAIMRSFVRKAPEHRQVFTDNFVALKQDLLHLDEQLKTITTNKGNQPLVASHPVYQYLARRYNLNVKMMMWEPDEDPGHAEWQKLKVLLIKHPAKWMVWEDDPLESSVNRLEDMDVQSTVFSPCFAKPKNGDFLSVMRENIRNMGAISN